MATPAYVATDEDFPAFFGVPAPQAPALPLDLTPKQYPREFCTLKNQSERWLWRLEHRKSKDVSPASMASFRSRLRKIFEIMPEDTLLSTITNEKLRVFVAEAAEPYATRENFPTFGLKKEEKEPVKTKRLAPATVNQMLVVLKLVLASATDCHGDRMFPLTFNSDFIDAPKIKEQHTPCLTASEIENMIALAKSDQERLLYIVLAASGLRISELQAVSTGPENEKHSTWDYETSSIYVRSQCFRNREISRLKTKAARRTVHLHSSVNELIAKHRRGAGSYLFPDATGSRPFRATSVRLNMSKRLSGSAPHSFRRFRTTFLRVECRLQEDILKLEIGHAKGADITNLYSRPSDETCAAAIEAAGIGFKILGEKNA